jgi:peptide/nickel transport system permease protein
MQHNRLADHISRLFSLFGVSMPIYWFGLILQLVLGQIPGMPINGRVDPRVAMSFPLEPITGLYTLDAVLTQNWTFLGSALLHLAMPTVCLAYMALVLVTRITRATMVEVLMQDYIRTARAFGLPERRVVWRHALRNAMLPVITMLGLTYGTMLGGSCLVGPVWAATQPFRPGTRTILRSWALPLSLP